MDLFLNFPEIFDEDKRILNTFKRVLLFSKKNKIVIYYSFNNLNLFKLLNEETEVYLTDEIKIIRQFLSSARSIKINEINEGVTYVRWNLNSFCTYLCNDVLSNIARKIYIDQKYKYLFLNIDNGIDTCRNKILVFRDCKGVNYPDFFVKIEFVVDFFDFLELYSATIVSEFSIKDETRFQKKASIIVKGATVYWEIATNRFWHLDTFHDYIEYEVYDSQGKHIGTANEKGELNFNGAKEERVIIIK